MSHHGDKDYSEYFNLLEERLSPIKNGEEGRQRPVAVKRKAKSAPKRKMRKSVLAVALALILMITLFAFIGGGSPKGDELQEAQKTEATQKAPEKTEISFKFPKKANDILAENDAVNAIIINKTTNKVVAARAAHTRAYPASTTKIMTLLTAAENLKDINDTFTVTYAVTDAVYAQGASLAGFQNDETVSVTDLFYGLILPSGADAAMALAVKVAGSEEAFVELMNQKVKELGLKNTHFTNVTGLHNEQNYSSAYDMAVILEAALQNKTCKKVLSTYQHTTAVTPQHPEGILLSSTLFNYMYGTEPETAQILGGKTGFVNESGYCIASYGESKLSGDEYIVVTLGNSDRHNAFFGQIDLYKEYAK